MANKKPEIIIDKTQMRKWSRAMRSQGKTIGFVPTMGYLHEGRISIIKEAHNHSDLVVVSIYVNPGQFSPSADLSTYPSDFNGDIQKLMDVPGGVDVVFHPHNLYYYGTTDPIVKNINGCGGGDEERDVGVVSCLENSDSGLGHETWVKVERLEKGMCGKSRPVFFRGVATVVTKLFNIVDPDVAVFGKKDYQQLRIIQRMNVYLSPEEREQALSISRSLSKARISAEKSQANCRELKELVIKAIEEAGGRVDYAEIIDQESLVAMEEITCPVVFCVAACFGKVRLIDNMEINM